MFDSIEETLLSLAETMPLEAFALIASFFEEVIAPIPSPAVMITAGSLAAIQGQGYMTLLVLAVLGAVGKVFGALVLYTVADKLEDVLSTKVGRFFGVTHEDIERLGKRLNNNARDYVLFTVLRALPFVPSSLLSLGSGFLRIPLRLFIVTTFFGTIIRDGIYLYLGFHGTAILKTIVDESELIESALHVVIFLVVTLALVYLYRKHRA